MAGASCDTCAFNVYDDEDECYYCEVNMDEDDAVRISQGQYKECPYYRNGDEYAIVRQQMENQKKEWKNVYYSRFRKSNKGI